MIGYTESEGCLLKEHAGEGTRKAREVLERRLAQSQHQSDQQKSCQWSVYSFHSFFNYYMTSKLYLL